MSSDRIWVYCPRCRASYPQGYRVCPRDGVELAATGADPLIGTVLDGRYRIVDLIGKGALGRVYRAAHVKIARRYAIKVPASGSSAQAQATQRLLNEAEAGGRIDHPNVVAVIDVGETAPGQPYLVMELAEGETLHAYLSRTGRVPVGAALAIARQLALGLEHVHARGLVHRDLAPDNVVIDLGGRVRICDFGLAIVLGGETKRVTGPGLAIGTPTYMAPEQAAGEEIDARADLFSLGVLLYRMITGGAPFDGEAGDVARTTIHGVLPQLGERRTGLAVAHAVDDLLQRMLARHPDDRIDSATAVLAEIDALRAGSPLSDPGSHPTSGGAPGEWTELPTARIKLPRSIVRSPPK